MQLSYTQRELLMKVVYYGPGLSGKTTNLQQLHARIDETARSHLLTVNTHDDRTLFFDLLPVHFRTPAGFQVKVKLFTVPGQVIHGATRKVVLQNADGVAFIADSRRSATDDNNAYWRDLMINMRDTGLDPAEVPVVIQFNKMDLPGARTADEIEEARKRGTEIVVGAVAIRGEGVCETFHAVLQQAYRKMEARSQLSRNIGLTEADLMGHVFGRMDLAGTRLPGRLG